MDFSEESDVSACPAAIWSLAGSFATVRLKARFDNLHS